MPLKKVKKLVPCPFNKDSLKPKLIAKSLTTAKANKARKDSLKVKQNEEAARALVVSKN